MSVLKNWVKSHFEDFARDDLLRNMFKNFVAYSVAHQAETGGAWTNSMLRQLAKLWKREQIRFSSKKVEWVPNPSLCPLRSSLLAAFPAKWFHMLMRSICYRLLEVARQVTLLEHHYFSNIGSQEFLGQGWTEKKKKKHGENAAGEDSSKW